jgi:hypothetical protein
VFFRALAPTFLYSLSTERALESRDTDGGVFARRALV